VGVLPKGIAIDRDPVHAPADFLDQSDGAFRQQERSIQMSVTIGEA
jgi:hypothetical protein